MNFAQLLEKVITKKDLTFEETQWVMNQIMDGEFTHAQMAAILTALRMKGETITELSALANVMRDKSTKIDVDGLNVIDTCGTGGDHSGSFNISTTVALLLAGGGYNVAKHGNRSMTSKSGSADVLEALGININLTPDQTAECVRTCGIGFLFAPALHSSMKNVVPVRKELAVRTVFNILGPLTNPANAKIQVIGLFDTKLVSKIAQVSKELGMISGYIFAGRSGLDEVCICDETVVAQVKPSGDIEEFTFTPEDYGYERASLESIKGGDAPENATITTKVLSGEEKGSKRDIVAINTGFAISAIDDIDLKTAFEKAESLLDQKMGITAIETLKNKTNSFC